VQKQLSSFLEQHKIQRARAIGAPQFLALTGQKNPDPFVQLTSGMDRMVDRWHLGGFAGWIDGMITGNYDLFVFYEPGLPSKTNLCERLQAASLKGPQKEVARLAEHIERNYTEAPPLIDPSLLLFVRKDLVTGQETVK
jgi:hypothetical protein